MNVLARAAVGALALLASAPAFAADTYELDNAHSSVVFRIKHFDVAYLYGRFNEVTGTFALDEADAAKSVVDIRVGAGSVDTHNEKRDQHLASPDFFNAKQYPAITFKSKKVTKKSGDTWTAVGDLTLHGVTKEVAVDFVRTGEGKDPWGGYRSGAEATFVVSRSAFGIAHMADGIGDEVRLHVSLEGVKK